MVYVCRTHSCVLDKISSNERIVKHDGRKPYVVRRTIYTCCIGCRFTVVEYFAPSSDIR